MKVIKNVFITSIVYEKKLIIEKISAFSSGLYHINIKHIDSCVVVNQKFNDLKTFVFGMTGLVTLGPQ